MAGVSSSTSSRILLILVAIIFQVSSTTLAARNLMATPQTTTEFIRKSCSSTTYPTLCYSSLSVHASKIQNSPKLLTSTALNVTLASAKSTSDMMSKLSKGQGMTPREVAAMRDCVEELGDSVDEIRRSMHEMSSAKQSDFQLMINDVQTWVSAALTDESTCSDGFAGKVMNGNLKTVVRGRIVTIAQLTSNALALINQYASVQG